MGSFVSCDSMICNFILFSVVRSSTYGLLFFFNPLTFFCLLLSFLHFEPSGTCLFLIGIICFVLRLGPYEERSFCRFNRGFVGMKWGDDAELRLFVTLSSEGRFVIISIVRGRFCDEERRLCVSILVDDCVILSREGGSCIFVKL